MSGKNNIVVAIEPPQTVVVPVPEYRKPSPPPSDPVARYGVSRLTSPLQILVHLQQWTQDQVRREGGDKPNENWRSWGYSLPDMAAVSIALSQALYEALESSSGKLRLE